MPLHRRSWGGSFAVGMLVVAAAACGRCDDEPTYHADIRPLLERHCLRCHSPQGVSPQPRFDTYEEAARHHAKIASAVQTRRMPPWGADNTGLCGTWDGALWLGEQEIATFVRWSELRAPAGRADPGRTPGPPLAPRLLRTDAVVDLGTTYSPGIGAGAYRCFVVDMVPSADGLLTALRVVSTEPRIVAQLSLYALDSAEAEAAAIQLDRSEVGPGYRCYGATRVDGERLLASWTWDAPVMRLPAGTGVPLRRGRKLVVKIHYDVTAVGNAASDRTRIDLEVAAPGTVREAALLPLRAAPFELPAAKEISHVTATLPIHERMTVHAVAPRMHTLGRALQVQLRRGQAAPRCVASFDHWNVYRQQLFRYEHPLDVQPGDTLHATCAFTTLNRPAIPMGEGIEQEQCVAYLYVTR